MPHDGPPYDAVNAQLAQRIAHIQDAEPPRGENDILAGVMSRIEPKKPSLRRRLARWLARPMTLTVRPWHGLAAGACATAALVLALQVEQPYLSAPMQAQNDGQPAIQPAAQPTAQPTAQQAPPLARGNTVRVQFTLDPDHFPTTKPGSVAVMGSFNNWSPQDHEMVYDAATGQWTAIVEMERGRHAYGFLVDGETVIPDPQALFYGDDGFGNTNSILILEGGGSGDGHGNTV